MLRVDLHLHSDTSPDGGLTPDDIARAIGKQLDYLAVTDHNSIKTALKLRRRFRERVIIGEEITTASGDIIGLFLKTLVRPGMALGKTIDEIKRQGGLVYIPHPVQFLQRSSLSTAEIERYRRKIDIIETFNARSLIPFANWRAARLARRLKLPGASASDAHGPAGLGAAYTLVRQVPTATNLPLLLENAHHIKRYQSLRGFLEPHNNRRKASKMSR